MNALCIIPARGGSKRIPRKNIRDFNGKPMIGYAIETAIASKLFDHVIVSTEDDEIIQVANSFGAETPFKRPTQLADDLSPTVPVIRHAIEEAEKLDMKFDFVCCIYPAVPLLKPEYISEALYLIKLTQHAFSFPIVEFPNKIQRALQRLDSGSVRPFYPEFELVRSQDLESAYYDAGQFYWAHKKSWKTIDNIHTNGVGLVVPRWSAIDIDTFEDWHFAEMLFQIRETII